MLRLLHPPSPEMVAKAKEILAKPEAEQFAFFLTTGPGEYAKQATPRGRQQRFRNWQRYIKTISEKKP